MAGVVQSRRGGRVRARGLRPTAPRLTPVFCFRPAESSRDGVKGSVHADDPASALAQRPRHSYCVWIR